MSAIRAERALLAAVLLLGALPHFWFAVCDQGMFWPDEIYQTLEQAHRFAFGYGIVPWEFADGARSWLLPGVLGLYWKALSLLGMHDGLALVIAAKFLIAALTTAGSAAAMLIALRLGGSRAALLTGVLMAAYPALLLLGHRGLSEVISAPVLMMGTALTLQSSRRALLAAGMLAGLAVFMRYQNGVVLVGLFFWLRLQQRGPAATHFALGALVAGAAGGLLDALTWGTPFVSFWNYLKFNLSEGAEHYGTADALFYARTAVSVTGPAVWALALGFLLGARRAAGLAAIAVAFTLVHGAIPHKEFRFLFPVVPFFLVVAGIGLADLLGRAKAAAPIGAAVGLLLAASMVQTAAATTFGDWGMYAGEPAAADSPWHADEGVNRLLHLAGQQADACGVWVLGMRIPWTGGFTYLHRDVMYPLSDDAVNWPSANYVLRSDSPLPRPIGWPGEDVLPAPYAPYAKSRGWVLYRRPGPCAPRPDIERRFY